MAVTAPNLPTYPGTSVRDGLRVRWEEQVHPDDRGVTDPRLQRRAVLYLTYHQDVTTFSTYSSTFLALLFTAMVSNIQINGYNANAGTTGTYRYPGDWDIDEISIDDQDGGMSRITFSVSRKLDWVSWTPAASGVTART